MVQGDGSFQKAIDDSRCPKCLAVIDYTRDLHIVKAAASQCTAQV